MEDSRYVSFLTKVQNHVKSDRKLCYFMAKELEKKLNNFQEYVVEFSFDFLIQFFKEVEFSSDFESLSGMQLLGKTVIGIKFLIRF